MSSDMFFQILSFILGTLISFIMSWYFYKKADFPSKVASDMTEDILLMFIQDRLRIDFLVNRFIPKRDQPKDTGIPHILQYWLSMEKTKPGGSIVMLFQVRDSGLDFPVDTPIRGSFELSESDTPMAGNLKGSFEVVESTSNLAFPVKREGHGYYSCQIDFPKNAPSGQHTIRLKLIDAKGNSHTHLIKLNIEQP